LVCAEAPIPTLRPIEVAATEASASASKIRSSLSATKTNCLVEAGRYTGVSNAIEPLDKAPPTGSNLTLTIPTTAPKTGPALTCAEAPTTASTAGYNEVAAEPDNLTRSPTKTGTASVEGTSYKYD
jgi:hypothetical protein